MITQQHLQCSLVVMGVEMLALGWQWVVITVQSGWSQHNQARARSTREGSTREGLDGHKATLAQRAGKWHALGGGGGGQAWRCLWPALMTSFGFSCSNQQSHASA